jgi:hypothetical protein
MVFSEIFGVETRQRRQARSFDMFARVFMRFSHIDEQGLPLVEAFFQRHRVD